MLKRIKKKILSQSERIIERKRDMLNGLKRKILEVRERERERKILVEFE